VFVEYFAESGNGLASEEKKILLERYGYDVDADDYFSQSSPKVFHFFPLFFFFFMIVNFYNILNYNFYKGCLNCISA
jgi:hypothetical protein